MKRRDLFAGSGGLAAASLSAPASAQPANARRVTHIPQANLSTIDPFWTTAYIARNHGYMVYDQLYGLDLDFKPQPQMVEGHTVENDGLLWRFTLRDGLKFHDGEPVRGVDCVASIQRWARRDAFGQELLARLAEFRTPSDKVFEIRLNRPFPLMLDAFAKVTTPVLFIMPERVARTDPFTQITDPTGSGPFVFRRDEWNPGVRAAYAKNTAYVPRSSGAVSQTAGPKVVNFDRAEWHIINDPATAAAALQSGEIDWWEQATADLYPLLQRNRNITVEIADIMGLICTFRPNHLTEPFNDVRVRRAVVTAINQMDIMTAVIGDAADWKKDRVGFFSPASPLASDVGLDRYKNSIDQARRELEAAGAIGKKLVLMNATDLASINAAGLVGADLFRRMGFDVEYVATDWGSVINRRALKNPINQGGWSGFFTFWSAIDHWNPAGHNALRGNADRAWFGWPDIPEIETARDEWFDAPNLAAQQAATRKIQQAAFDKVPYVPSGQYFQPTAYRKSLTGVLKGPPLFWNIRRA